MFVPSEVGSANLFTSLDSQRVGATASCCLMLLYEIQHEPEKKVT